MRTRVVFRISPLLLLLLALSAGVARAAAPTRGGEGRACLAAQRGPALRADAHLRAAADLPVLPFVAARPPLAVLCWMVATDDWTTGRSAGGGSRVRSPLPRSPPVSA